MLPWLTDVAGVLATTVSVRENIDEDIEEAVDLGDVVPTAVADFCGGAGLGDSGDFTDCPPEDAMRELCFMVPPTPKLLAVLLPLDDPRPGLARG